MEKQEDNNFDKISKLLAEELRKGKKQLHSSTTPNSPVLGLLTSDSKQLNFSLSHLPTLNSKLQTLNCFI